MTAFHIIGYRIPLAYDRNGCYSYYCITPYYSLENHLKTHWESLASDELEMEEEIYLNINESIESQRPKKILSFDNRSENNAPHVRRDANNRSKLFSPNLWGER